MVGGGNHPGNVDAAGRARISVRTILILRSFASEFR
jgi:hypothetical protein